MHILNILLKNKRNLEGFVGGGCNKENHRCMRAHLKPYHYRGWCSCDVVACTTHVTPFFCNTLLLRNTLLLLLLLRSLLRTCVCLQLCLHCVQSLQHVRYKLSRVGFVLMVPLLVLAVSFHGWVQLRRSRVCNPCNTLPLLLLRSLLRTCVCLQLCLHSVQSLQHVRYKLSRVGFVLMVPLLVLAVPFHGWVQLRRSRVCNPCNTLLLLPCSTIHLQPGRFEQTVPSVSSQRLSVYYSFHHTL
jgi:heme/copper-type cytochrome/quinol oxidase subunit 4